MKTWVQVIGTGRSQIEVRVSAKEPQERTPEEHERVKEAVRRILGEPTPEMFEKPRAGVRRAGGRQAAPKGRAA